MFIRKSNPLNFVGKKRWTRWWERQNVKEVHLYSTFILSLFVSLDMGCVCVYTHIFFLDYKILKRKALSYYHVEHTDNE